jgi:hypothetical protein
MTLQFDLQTAYNVVVSFGFLICMYKLSKLERELNQLKNHQFIHTVTSFVMARKLKEKGIMDEDEIAVEIEKENEKL